MPFWSVSAIKTLWKENEAPDEREAVKLAYASDIPAPKLHDISGRVVVKLLTTKNAGLALQTIGRVNRGNIFSVYSFEDNVIGNGNTGQVRTAVSRHTGNRFAIKSFIKTNAPKEKVNLLRNEAQLALRADYPHISRLIEIWEDSNTVHLVMDYCREGDLADWITKRNVLPQDYEANESIARVLMLQIVRTICYMHSQSIVHRDLKLDHWMIDGTIDGKLYQISERVPFLKLIDFGLARIYQSGSRSMRATCGTLPYTAPEVLLGNYTAQCDLWSAGVIAYTLVVGYPPFYGSEETITRRILNPARIRFPEQCRSRISYDCRQFILKLLTFNPSDRMTASEAYNDAWLSPLTYDNVIQATSNLYSTKRIQLDFWKSIVYHSQSTFFRKVVTALMAFGLSGDQVHEARQIFLLIDDSGNGTIELDAMQQFLEKMDPQGATQSSQFARSIDTFQRGSIHFNDFIASLIGYFIVPTEKMLQGTFWKLDRKRTGLVSVESLAEVFGSLYGERTLEKFLREADQDGNKYIDFNEFRSIVVPSVHKYSVASI